MTAAWPATIPAPGPGPTIRPDSALADTAIDFGMRHVRRRMTAPWETVTLEWILTDAEKGALDDFFVVDCQWGAGWFSAPWLAWLGFSHHQARFKKPPDYDLQAPGVWRAQSEIEVRDAGFSDGAHASPNHDPNVQSGLISPFEGKLYRFYDDFSTYQGWMLEAGSAPTHDAANKRLTIPPGTTISKPLSLDFSDIAAGKAVAVIRALSNVTRTLWGAPYPYYQGDLDVALVDDSGNGYASRFYTYNINNYSRTEACRIDAGAYALLVQSGGHYIKNSSIPTLYLTLACAEGTITAIAENNGSSPMNQASATDTTHGQALRVRLRAVSKNLIVNSVEVEFS